MKHVIYGEDGQITEERDYPDPDPVFQPISMLDFLDLLQGDGGMTDAMLVAAKNDPAMAALWIKFSAARDVERDKSITVPFINALVSGGYLPKGKAAVLKAWRKA